MSKFSELQQSFFKHLCSLFELTLGKDDKDIDNILIQQGRTEDEKKVINDICEEVDLEHRLMNDLKNSGLDSGEWLEREIETVTKEMYPNATPEEIELVKQEVEDGIEKEIESEADSLEEEMSVLSFQEESNTDDKKEEKV